MLPLLLLLAMKSTLGVALRLAATILKDASNLNAKNDYIIVSGGTSGLIVAYRLTDNISYMITIPCKEG